MAIAWLAVAVSIVGIIAAPTLVMVIRLAMRWKGIEDTLRRLVKDVEDLQDSTNKRLRWLEENQWRRSGRPPSLPTCYKDKTFLLSNLTSSLVG